MEETTTSGNRAQTTQATQDSPLDKVMKRLDALEEENSMLKSLQDPTHLAAAQANSNTDTRKRVRVRLYEGKIVTGWDRMKNNDVRIRHGEIVETQTLYIHTHDGESEEIALKDFNEMYLMSLAVPITKESLIENGDVMFTLEIPVWNKNDHGIDVEESFLIEVNSKFVN